MAKTKRKAISQSRKDTSDPACALLFEQLQTPHTGKSLWLADENALDIFEESPPKIDLLISNRLDICEKSSSCSIESVWSDFAMDETPDNSLGQVVYRVSKEKPLVHFLINQAHQKLRQNGQLILFGLKNDGIKSYAEKAKSLFCDTTRLNKHGAAYSITLTKQADSGDLLDTNSYSNLRDTLTINDALYASKPGIFGWNKIDKGSELLIENTSQYLTNTQWKSTNSEATRLLDLGCGYGYLSIAASHMLQELPLHLTLTDNNATALIAAKENAERLTLENPLHHADCQASDAGSTIKGPFNLILCNPPFHQGHTIDTRLTDKFLANTKRLLTSNGLAFYVVNQFIGLEKKAAANRLKCETLDIQNGFKVLLLKHQ